MLAASRRRRCAAAAVLALVALVAQAADSTRGQAIYEGREWLPAVAGGPAPQPCVHCHRPSGMGNFEGGLVVPPIAGPTLFEPFDRDTAHYFPAASRFRVRPAYNEASLGHLLRIGVAPDGQTMQPAMPRYALTDDALADLTAYLRGLSASPPPGLDADVVRIATITTPDADPARRDAMLATLVRFIEQKNGQSRQEAQRSVQAARTREMVMYRKFRVWRLSHWALEGEPATWGAQLDRWQSERPVYAVVAGLGRAEWAPVDTFCERARLPCLLPLVEAGGGGGFYGLHFHAGIDQDVRIAAQALRERRVDTVAMWSEPMATALAQRVRQGLQREGLQVVDHDAPDVVSLLDPGSHARRLRQNGQGLRTVAWLSGTHALGSRELAAALPQTPGGFIVSPMHTGAGLDQRLLRTRLWLQAQKLQELPLDVAASTLQAATVLGEGLAHVDFRFTQAYLLELLEHGLENVVPWSPYPRLAIGPDQRVASKGSWLGVVQAGQVDWQWRVTP